jgi:glycosyltransferase involved in cell wall biosynthesis
VPTVLPYLAEARIALVPLHVGSGTRLKALEAMATGRPVVGTTVGLEGLGITDGVEAAVADKPGAMAGRIVELLEDDELASRMAAAGRKLVERSFCWSVVAKPFVEKVVELAQRRELRRSA